MNPSDEITICFKVCPGRSNEIYNAVSSMLEIDPYAKNVLIIFNPYDPADHDSLLDISEIRHSDIIKLSKFESLAKAWNQSMLFSNTRYCLMLDDDIVFKDEKVLEKIHEKHQEGFPLVHVTENWSGFSIDKALIPKVGWFDENYSYAWEDIDFRYRMAREGIPSYRFEEDLIRHLRSSSGRVQERWDASSKYFFEKWDIEKFVVDRHHQNEDYKIGIDFSSPESRAALQQTGFFRNTGPRELTPALQTPNFYPVEMQKYDYLYNGKMQ